MTSQYQCYTEITHQTLAWQQAVDTVLAEEGRLRGFIESYQPDQIIFLACGSPYYLGLSAAVYWQRIFKVPVRSVMASELLLYPDGYMPPVGKRPLLLIVSRSGSTSEVLWALDQFNNRFPRAAILITCSPESPLSQRIEHKLLLPEAMEQTVPQTRSFAAMFLAVQLLGSLLGQQQVIADALIDAPRHADRLINAWEEKVFRLISENSVHNLFYLGSGPMYGIARESALKMAEMSLTEAFAYPFLESRHGPRSLIDENTMVVGLFGQTGYKYHEPVLQELVHDSHAHTVALTPAETTELAGATTHFSLDISWPDDIQGLAYLPLVQLMAYYRATTKGVNPDKSRNLMPYVQLNEGADSEQ